MVSNLILSCLLPLYIDFRPVYGQRGILRSLLFFQSYKSCFHRGVKGWRPGPETIILVRIKIGGPTGSDTKIGNVP